MMARKPGAGRGRVPGWVLEHEADGGDREELAIKLLITITPSLQYIL